MTEPAPAGFPVTTAFTLPGMTVERDLGVAFGLVVRSMGAIKWIGASFKAMRQGEVTQYTELLEDSRRHAIDRMIENAQLLGANGIVAMRFDSSEIGQQLTEIVAYGTAVVTRPAALAMPGTPPPAPPPGPQSPACWRGRPGAAAQPASGALCPRAARPGRDRASGWASCWPRPIPTRPRPR